MNYLPLHLQRTLPLVNTVYHCVSDVRLVNAQMIEYDMPRWYRDVNYKHVDAPLIMSRYYNSDVEMLHDACRKGHLCIIKYLVEKRRVNINARNDKNDIALSLALAYKQPFHIIKYLVEHKSLVHTKCFNDKWILYDAIYSGYNIDVIKYLLDHGAYITCLPKSIINTIINNNKNGPVALYFMSLGYDQIENINDAFIKICSMRDSKELIEYFIKHNSIDKNDTVPITNAIKSHQSFDVLKKLYTVLSNDTKVDVLNDLVYNLVSYGYSKDVIQYFASNEQIKNASQYLAHCAYIYNTLDTVLWFKELGIGTDNNAMFVSVLEAMHTNITRIKYSNEPKPTEALKYLIDQGVDINACIINNNEYTTPLLLIINAKYPLELVKYMIQKGANVHATTSRGNNALHYAIGTDDIELIKYLIDCGVDVNADSNDSDIDTPLSILAFNESTNIKMYKLLLKHGASVHTKGKYSDETLLETSIIGNDCLRSGHTMRVIDLFEKYGQQITVDMVITAISHNRSVKVIKHIANKIDNIAEKLDAVYSNRGPERSVHCLVAYILECNTGSTQYYVLKLLRYFIDERGVKINPQDKKYIIELIHELDNDDYTEELLAYLN